MSKAVLYSVQPMPCGNICNHKKTVEIRKTIPKLQPPFKAYIYCTKPNTNNPNEILEIHGADEKIRKANGKVIGEFICDMIDTYEMEGYSKTENVYQSIKEIIGDDEDMYAKTVASNEMASEELCNVKLLKESCLSFDEIGKYVCGKKEFGFHTFYGHHISDLVIYDKPKKLSELHKHIEIFDGASIKELEELGIIDARITRPPQSWCYVEELEE